MYILEANLSAVPLNLTKRYLSHTNIRAAMVTDAESRQPLL